MAESKKRDRESSFDSDPETKKIKTLSEEEEKRIELFKETYNVRYIENFVETKKNEIISKINNNPILLQLLENANGPKPYIVKHIEGPKEIYNIVLGKKTFQLFGERHRQERVDHCRAYNGTKIEFQQYIKGLSIYSPSFFDLYTELGFIKKNSQTKKYEIQSFQQYDIIYNSLIELNNRIKEQRFEESLALDNIYIKISELLSENKIQLENTTSYMLNNIKQLFLNCIQPSTRNADECKLYRIHNIDLRGPESHNPNSIEMIDYFFIIYFIINSIHIQYKSLIILDEDHSKGREFLNKLIENDSLSFDNYIDIIKTNKNINNEINNSYMSNEIIVFARQEFDEIINNLDINTVVDKKKLLFHHIKRFIDILDEESDATNNRDNAKLEEINNFNNSLFPIISKLLFELQTLMMDLYTLCRMFKNHDILRSKQYVEGQERRDIEEFQPKESTNIIFYGGYNHTQKIRKFLLLNGGQELYQYINPKNRNCVTMFNEEDKEYPLQDFLDRNVPDNYKTF